ncbi:SDR family NAD(P)-dependent oxidoreductase [Streptomyces sp. NPDC005760]|uniref:SDR family NAD(P)-dependent oxidoreductase n=1 Tax=Streptomyces sp. NPDC005760 TaxID=3156718 RepID=UPI0033F7453B
MDAASELGPLRVAVSCAGVATPGRMLSRSGPLNLDAFARVVQVNLVGTFTVLRLAARRIAESWPVDGECGVLVATSSVAAYDAAGSARPPTPRPRAGGRPHPPRRPGTRPACRSAIR